MGKATTWVLARLKERTTWLGLTGLLSVFGITLEPAQAEAIGLAGVALASAILTFTADKGK